MLRMVRAVDGMTNSHGAGRNEHFDSGLRAGCDMCDLEFCHFFRIFFEGGAGALPAVSCAGAVAVSMAAGCGCSPSL